MLVAVLLSDSKPPTTGRLSGEIVEGVGGEIVEGVGGEIVEGVDVLANPSANAAGAVAGTEAVVALSAVDVLVATLEAALLLAVPVDVLVLIVGSP